MELSQGLRQAGWFEGQNLRTDVRWNAGDADPARTYAAQLTGLMPDVILADATSNLTVIGAACRRDKSSSPSWLYLASGRSVCCRWLLAERPKSLHKLAV